MRLANHCRLAELSLCSVWVLSACGGGGGSSNPNTSTYSVGGTLSGLASGASVVLQNSGGNTTTVSANGNFTFSTPVTNSAVYAVTVLTQPTGQTCTVTSGGGTVNGSDVTSVHVTCAIKTYTISGSLSGLNSGAQVTVRNNAGDPTTVKANGTFSFATPIPYNGSYAVTVATQPPAQTCAVTAGSGSSVTSNVSGVSVACGLANESVIHTFDVNPDGFSPRASAIQGSDGNYYGTTYVGGTNNLGTVYKITPTGVETVLHSFMGGATDGSLPTAALIQGSDGNFYGTTTGGGPIGAGTVFKITATGDETVLYAFIGGDGIGPFGALVQGNDGNFYGTTSGGGPNFNGTVFKITPAGVETMLHSFTGGTTDGRDSGAALIQGSDGNFYGTTGYGGTSDNGTVFKITPAGVETVLYSFAGGTTDGSAPTAALIQGSDGNFYGTTGYGGTSNVGTVFKVTPAGVETVLHSFANVLTDGNQPQAALIQGSDGNFYGTTGYGGTSNVGTVFKVTPAGVETVFYSFTGATTDGGGPQGALIQGSDGIFYGTTSSGGASNSGSFIKISTTGTESMVYSFNSGSEGQTPVGMIQGSDGNFYGTTYSGGTSSRGTVFKLTSDGVETVLHSFAGSSSDGGYPAPLTQGSDGNFYGTTQLGGTSNVGTVFKVTPAGVETVLHSFVTTDGSQPQSALTQGIDGNLYGTTDGGGANGVGTVFKITPTGVLTVVYSFALGTDGDLPSALIQGTNGDFYGTTTNGGLSGHGTVFKITPAGAETVLYSFAGGTTDGSAPNAALILGSDGIFYGTTSGGGTNNLGTAFRMTPAGAETVLYSFAGGTSDASTPNAAALIEGNDGNFYGTSVGGGGFGKGTVFKITPAGVETVLYSFTGGSDGGNPDSFIIGIDGIFYGTTAEGGSSNLGTVFKF
jgi:uncharacterized repeat protein (TIGR03803 family)